MVPSTIQKVQSFGDDVFLRPDRSYGVVCPLTVMTTPETLESDTILDEVIGPWNTDTHCRCFDFSRDPGDD